jgi:hypothetical protein
MHPSFEQFVAALRDSTQRPGIGLSISDEDAAALLTRADWVNDYYSRWIALFPAEAPAAAPMTAPTAASSSPFGPPPATATTASFGFAPAAAPATATYASDRGAASRRLTIIGLWIVAGVINGVVTLTHASALTSTRPPAAATSSSGTGGDAGTDDPVVFHGLTQTEYGLLEAVLAPQGGSLEQAVAGGATDDDLRRLAAKEDSSTAKTCSDAKLLENGFDNATFRAGFLARYESVQKVTEEQAAKVFDAFAAYCAAH